MQTSRRPHPAYMSLTSLWHTVLVLFCSLASEERLQAAEPEKRAKLPLVQAPLAEPTTASDPTPGQASSSSTELPSPLGPPTKKELEEIKAAVGINLFEGTLFEDQERLSSSAGTTITDLAEVDPTKDFPTTADTRESSTGQPTASAGQVTRLRKAARDLEKAASSLEDCGNYDEADRLRALAAGYWRKARSSASDALPAPGN